MHQYNMLPEKKMKRISAITLIDKGKTLDK